MKKKIIIGLSIFCLIFIVGGSYIIISIETATTKLDDLITLHQVSILREHLLLQIKKVQSDIHLKNTRYARNINTIVSNVRAMEKMSGTCLDCHHSRDMQYKLNDLKKEVREYQGNISRLFTMRTNSKRLLEDEDRAFQKGEKLIETVHAMINMASMKLEHKTRTSLREIDETKEVLYYLVIIVPFLAGVLGYIFIGGFTGPVKKLLNATRKLKSGDMDFRIEGLESEFGEVAESFNEMSCALKENMHMIRENERRYRTLFESAGDAIFMVDSEGDNMGVIVSANKAAADMHGYTVEELEGLSLFNDIDSSEDAVLAPERVSEMLNGEWIHTEINHRKKDGTVFPVEASAGIFEFMGSKYILAIDRDITDRKKAEGALLRSHVMFTTVLDSIDAIIYVSDMETYEVLYLNRYARKLFGDIEGKVCWRNIQSGLDGPCDFCGNDKLITPEGDPSGVIHKEVFSTFNGKWYDVYNRAIEWVDGRIVRFEIASDITERVKMDKALKRAEQMKLVGEWAAGLAHEIKNALAGIKISIEVMAEEPALDEEDRDSVVKAVDEIKRIELLLKRMLNFAKPPELQLFVTNVNELLDNALNYSIRPASASEINAPEVSVVKDYDIHLPVTMADRLQLRQVFMNIIMNANEAMQNNGTLMLKTSYDAVTNNIFVEISDDGEGLEKEIIDKIFNPFFTTKSKGSGLGLAISKRIVELHGGDIYVENKSGGGVLFTIRIPMRGAAEEQKK